MSAAHYTPIDPATLPKFRSGRTSDATFALAPQVADSVEWRSDRLNSVQLVSTPVDDGEIMFDRLVALKLASADFGERLNQAWRAGLFEKLDDLLDANEWDFTHEIPSVASFKTFLRMVIHNGVTKRPSLGATSDGKIIASWRSGEDRLVVECFANDDVRWVASRHINGKPVSGAGSSHAGFLRTALIPYSPEAWFG